MNEAQSRGVCEILAGLIFADGELHEAERALLERVKARFGLPASFTPSPETDPDAALEKLRALPEADRHETLSLLIEAASADGVLHHAERVLIGAVGDELGVPDAEIDARLRAALSSSPSGG